MFLRSQREWVSFRDSSAWDLFVISADGTGEQRIAQGGYHPVQRRLSSSPVPGVPSWRAFILFRGDFELSPDQRHLAFALRRPFEAAVFDLDTHRLSPLTRVQACQTTWAPDGRALSGWRLEVAAGRG